MADDSSELSSVSSLSPPPSEDEAEIELKSQDGILKFFHRVSKHDDKSDKSVKSVPPRKRDLAPPPRKRSPSPPHVAVFEDNPDIAFIVMFRKRFDSVMPRSLAHYGPLELEHEIRQDPPTERVEHLLCVVLGLLLNRKQDIKIGHYHKALNEDAINGKDFKPQWPRSWAGQSPLTGGGTFHTISAEKRLDLLKVLALWTLSYSDAIKAVVNASYNQKRTNDDLNQPLSVQPWGQDSDKRRYYLIEGDDNCSFRVYREGNPAALYNRQWISVAGSIDEVKALAEKLATTDGGQHACKLSKSIMNNIVNFEEKEEKRKRREYRRLQKERFRRPEPDFSMYEGRTRGKRVKYTYSDDEDFYTDSTNNRRSTRNTRNHSPIETGGRVTASGRQSRPLNRLSADNLSNASCSAAPSLQGDVPYTEMVGLQELGATGRPRRSAAVHYGTNGWSNPRKRTRPYISEDDDEGESNPADLGDEEDFKNQDETEDEEEFQNEAIDEDDDEVAAASPRSNDSRVVKLHIKVKFDKDGKAKRIRKIKNRGRDSTRSASTPSNLGSSPEAADSASESSPSDVPDHEPQRTEDVIQAAPLVSARPDWDFDSTPSAAPPPSSSSPCAPDPPSPRPTEMSNTKACSVAAPTKPDSSPDAAETMTTAEAHAQSSDSCSKAAADFVSKPQPSPEADAVAGAVGNDGSNGQPPPGLSVAEKMGSAAATEHASSASPSLATNMPALLTLRGGSPKKAPEVLTLAKRD